MSDGRTGSASHCIVEQAGKNRQAQSAYLARCRSQPMVHYVGMLAVALSPVAQGFEHRAQTLPFFGEVVLQSRGMVAVNPTGDQPMIFHRFQACGECIWSNASE
jgi:hypothetical protein